MQNIEYPSLMHCEAMKIGVDQQIRYDVLVAFKSQTLINLDSEISRLLAIEGYKFLFSTAPIATNKYLEQSVKHYATVVELCQQLSDREPIVFKPIAILDSEIIEHARVDCVDIQSVTSLKEVPIKGTPFWERQWIDPELKKRLFDPNQANYASTSVNPIRTYLLVDATLYIEQRGVFDLDLIDDCPVMCMFTGEAAKTLKMAAPYLIDITLNVQAYHDDSHVSHFHRRYFETMWGNNVGICLQTQASMKAVHQHFRKFLKFKLEGANNRFFRFWDPRVLKVHLPILSHYGKASHKFFHVPNTNSAEQRFDAVSFLYEVHNDAHCSKQIIEPANDKQYEEIITKIASFNNTNYAQTQRRNEFGQYPNAGQDTALQDIVTNGFSTHKTHQFCLETQRWLVTHYGDKDLNGIEISDFFAQQIPIFEEKYDIENEYAMKNALQGCYLLAKNIDEIPGHFLQLLEQWDISTMQRSDNFVKAIFDAVYKEQK